MLPNMAETESNEATRAPLFPTMSDTTTDVLVKEREDAMSRAAQQSRHTRAAKIMAEIDKNERDLDQCDEAKRRYNREFLYNVRKLENLISITACPVPQQERIQFGVCPFSKKTKGNLKNERRELDEPLKSDPRWREGVEWEHVRQELRDLYVPLRARKNNPIEEQNILVEQVRALFGKTTTSAFPALVEEFRSLGINYAGLCYDVHLEQIDTGAETSLFRTAFLDRIERAFRNMVKAIEWKKFSADADIDEEQRNMRMRMIGKVKFFGHLYLHGIPSVRFVLFHINHPMRLIDITRSSYKNDEYMECVLQLLKVIGKRLHEQNLAAAAANRPEIVPFDDLFQTLEDAKLVVSERVRIMLMDLVDFRANGWVDVNEVPENIETDEKLDGRTKAIDNIHH